MIEELMLELRLLGALNFYQSLKEDLPKEDLLLSLLKSELENRTINRSKRRIISANFPYEREWPQIDINFNPKIDFRKIMNFSSGKFIDSKRNLCFIGSPGLGKTHSLISLGRDLCKIGYNVKFFTAIDLVNKLEESKLVGCLSKLMDKLMRPDLIIIDEMGFVPLSDNGARLLFDVFSKRYNKGSIAISTNLSLPKWIQTFGSIELTNALIDRFTHNCDIFIFEGESFRFNESKLNKAK